MFFPGLVVRALTWLGLACGAVLALASMVVLHGASLLGVMFAAGLVAVLAYGIRDDGLPPSPAAAWKAAAGTVLASMVVTGLVVLVGVYVAAVACAVGLTAGGAAWIWRGVRARLAARGAGDRSKPQGAAVFAAPVSSAGWPDWSASPVSLLSVPALGTEWRRTTAGLTCGPDPVAQEAVVRRRQEVLDELERRDPVGFAGWLATGTASDSDPADFLQCDAITDNDEA